MGELTLKADGTEGPVGTLSRAAVNTLGWGRWGEVNREAWRNSKLRGRRRGRRQRKKELS